MDLYRPFDQLHPGATGLSGPPGLNGHLRPVGKTGSPGSVGEAGFPSVVHLDILMQLGHLQAQVVATTSLTKKCCSSSSIGNQTCIGMAGGQSLSRIGDPNKSR